MLAASSKVGKSWMLLDLATSIATGTRFLKWNTTAGRVLFINFEIHRAFIKKRLQILQERKQLTNLDNLDIWTLRGASANPEELLERIIDETRADHYALIILDPIYKLMVGRSENMAGGVGALCHNVERLVEETGAAAIYAHHFTKGNQSKKTAMDRMSGSGVFARDADTIITLTEHEEERCFTVELTLRNLPPQQAFVVEWNFPLMVERADLDPKDLKGERVEDDGDLETILALLDDRPLRTGEWERAAQAKGYSHATFFRMKEKIDEGKRVTWNRRERTWARAGAATAAEPGPAPAGSRADQRETSETVETSETTETTETAETPTAGQAAPSVSTGQEVSGLKSIKSLNTPCSSAGELLADAAAMSSADEGRTEEGAEGKDNP